MNDYPLPPKMAFPRNLYRTEIGRYWYSQGAGDGYEGRESRSLDSLFSEHGKTARDGYQAGYIAGQERAAV